MSREMKNSGIPWIGEIPSHWEVEILKFVFEERNERSICGEETLLSLSQYTGIKPKAETDIADSHIAESYEGYKIVRKGDFVMNIMLAWNGSYAVSDYDGMISPAYCVFRFRNNKYYKKYYHYLLRTEGYPSAFKTLSRGIMESRLRLYPEQFYIFSTLVPPLTEQKAIADFLDKQCVEVDEMVALQEKIIEELRAYRQALISDTIFRGIDKNVNLMDSGQEWLGKIPAHWELRPLKYVFTQRREKNDPIKSTERLSLSIGAGVTPYAEKTTNLDRFKDDFTQYQLAYPNDIVLNCMNMIVGAVGRSDYFGCVSPVYYVIYPTHEDNPYYYGYLLNTPAIRSVYHALGQGIYAIERGDGRVNTCRLKVPYEDFGRITIPVPPIDEQQAIADFLDTKTKDIDQLITIKQKKIEELKEYKKSLIYEYVTGKKEVTL